MGLTSEQIDRLRELRLQEKHEKGSHNAIVIEMAQIMQQCDHTFVPITKVTDIMYAPDPEDLDICGEPHDRVKVGERRFKICTTCGMQDYDVVSLWDILKKKEDKDEDNS